MPHPASTLQPGGRSKLATLLAAGFAVWLVAGCGSDKRPDPLQRGLASVTDSELAAMLPAATSLDARLAPLRLDGHSGFTSNDQAAAASTVDPYDTGGDVDRAGRVIGYTLSWVAPTRGAIATAGGVVELDASVDLFVDAGKARRFHERQSRDLLRYAGVEVEPGVQLGKAATFAVPALGDQAIGSRVEFKFGNEVAHTTFVDFRVGRLLVDVGVTRLDERRIDATAVELARKLKRRIERILLGRPAGPPVPLLVKPPKHPL